MNEEWRPEGAKTEAEFFAEHPDVLTFSSWGARWVGSALTKRHYIYFDHTRREYVKEAR
ncbi:hypothetical protein ACWEVY_28790 [Streptomyces longwoodensis]